MNHCRFFLFMLLCSHTVFAQFIIEGTVTDKQTGLPVSNAYVYINNGKQIVFTDLKGVFVLNDVPYGQAELVCSHISYGKEILLVKSTVNKVHLDIKLTPAAPLLQEVFVSGNSRNDFEKWGALFREYFIGSSAFAGDCEIVNPEALIFSYSKARKRLKVFSGQSLHIRNMALGYDLFFDLDSFNYSFNTNLIDYTSTLYFREIPPQDAKQAGTFAQNRQTAYLGSRLHFIRALYSGYLREEGFDIFRFRARYNQEKARVNKVLLGLEAMSYESNRLHSATDPEQLITNKDSAKYYKEVLSMPDYIFSDTAMILGSSPGPSERINKNTRSITIKDTLLIAFHAPVDSVFINENRKMNREQRHDRSKNGPDLGFMPANYVSRSDLQFSLIYLVTKDPLMIREDGYYYPGLNLFTDGYMGWKKAANLLPWDYKDAH